VAACPRGAILTEPERRIDFAQCDACGRCAEACGREALRVIGRRYGVEALLAEILKDRDYFAESGGGVTLSGGEPTMHTAYLRTLLPRLAAERIHVVLQTCGLFRWDEVAALLPYVDLVQFDLKHMDSAMHTRLTGAGNERILANFTRLVASGMAVEPRMPVIPGLNDDAENVRATAEFLARHGHRTLACLPYHDFGEAKLRRLAPILAPLGRPRLDAHGLAPFAHRFGKEGIDVVVCD
jgi:pyruvate formate lyase activating enzyme